MLQDSGELDVVEEPVLDGRLLEEVVHFLAAEAVAEGHQDLAEIILGQGSCNDERIESVDTTNGYLQAAAAAASSSITPDKREALKDEKRAKKSRNSPPFLPLPSHYEENKKVGGEKRSSLHTPSRTFEFTYLYQLCFPPLRSLTELLLQDFAG